MPRIVAFGNINEIGFRRTILVVVLFSGASLAFARFCQTGSKACGSGPSCKILKRLPEKIMTAHQRNLSASIDPVKLDRLAEVAIKVGLRLQAGQD